jgi:phage-related protein (TIGR01555 family)
MAKKGGTKKDTGKDLAAQKIMQAMISKFGAFKSDGWKNLIIGLGKKVDKTESTFFGHFPILDDEELTRMYMGEGIGKKIVGVVADDMTKNWIDITQDDKEEIAKELKRLKTFTEVNSSLRWARLYRGSITVIGVQDGKGLDQPLDLKNLKGKEIKWLKTYPASKIQMTTNDIVKEQSSPYFEDIEVFTIQKTNGNFIKVHQSRCMVFKGETIPKDVDGTDFQNEYWGISTLQSIWKRLSNFGSIETSFINLMLELVIGKYKVEGLSNILASNNTKAVMERMEIINVSKSLLNMLIMGENEDFIRDTVNLAGVPDMFDRFMMSLSAVSEIPVTRLFGRSPAGENATGESDLITYYDMIKTKQITWLQPPLQYLVSIIALTQGSDPEKHLIEFNPVWVPTQQQLIEMRSKQAETDKIYLETGVLSQLEVRRERFLNGYSFETSVETEEPEDGDFTEETTPQEPEEGMQNQ